MHPTLLIGPADWDATRMPRAEFDSRIGRLWQACPQASGAVVYGSPRRHAELAWLTAFTPKLESAIALIPRDGAPKLMVGGGANMLPAARPLTWVEDLVSLRPTGKTISEWLAGAGGARPVTIGAANMPMRMHREVMESLGGTTFDDGTVQVHGLMAHKSVPEIAAIREACAVLDASVAAMADAERGGAGATEVILAGEHAAIRHGAQDVRTLFSEIGRPLRPFTEPVVRAIDPLRVYVAVRKFGYWAEGFVVLSKQADGGAVRRREQPHPAIVALKPGVPLPSSLTAVDIGLSLDGAPQQMLEAGGVYSIRLSDEPPAASAMVLAEQGGISIFWPSP